MIITGCFIKKIHHIVLLDEMWTITKQLCCMHAQSYKGLRGFTIILFCVLNLFIKYNGNLCIVNLLKFYCYISNIIFIITTFFMLLHI